MKTIPIASLVEDFALYPRNSVDDTHVRHLALALQSGAVLPPPVVDEKSKRIVDGFHRVRAHIKVFGADAKIQVEMRSYKSDAEMFLEAARLNAGHGRRLDRHDQTRIVLRARELGVADSQIAIAINLPEPEVMKLSLNIVMVDDEAEPSKRGGEWLRGTTITTAQHDVIRKVRSLEVGRLCLELTRILEHDLWDRENAQHREALAALGKAIRTALKSKAA